VCLERQGQREKAINILNLIKQKPSFQSQQPKLFNNIGVMHHKNGNIAAAKDFIEKALLEDEKPQSRAAPASGAGVQESTLQSLS
jgi:Tfp pilus assembly protein PilF